MSTERDRGRSEVVLTPLRASDRDALFEWINDRGTVQLNAPYRPVTYDAHCAWFEGITANPRVAIFAIRETREGPAIGTAQLFDLDFVHRSAELQIRIGRDGDRGRGAGTQAVRALLEHAFHDLNLHRVWLRVFATNGRAIRCYEKAGFAVEGTMKDAAWIDGTWVDQVIMAVVADR